MDRFARLIVGYHGCRSLFAGSLLLGHTSFDEWQQSQNRYDWLGEGIYFWEHSPARAARWARERFGAEADVIGAVIQLGACFDLTDESSSQILANSYTEFRARLRAARKPLPKNRGRDGKFRELDCAVINACLERMALQGQRFDSVRGAFLEGAALFPGTTLSAETHIQIAVRNVDCILGVFRPNLGREIA